jgi:hypothetical protein
MIHVVVMKCLMMPLTISVGLIFLIHIEFHAGVGDLKIGESEFCYQLHSPASRVVQELCIHPHVKTSDTCNSITQVQIIK